MSLLAGSVFTAFRGECGTHSCSSPQNEHRHFWPIFTSSRLVFNWLSFSCFPFEFLSANQSTPANFPLIHFYFGERPVHLPISFSLIVFHSHSAPNLFLKHVPLFFHRPMVGLYISLGNNLQLKQSTGAPNYITAQPKADKHRNPL